MEGKCDNSHCCLSFLRDSYWLSIRLWGLVDWPLGRRLFPSISCYSSAMD
jgi:hypothetical protein